MLKRITIAVAVLVTGAAGGQAARGQESFDVVVYGGTSGGITAAIQSKRMGKTVVLISPEKHLGGLTTGGLGATDIGNKGAIGGMAREFYGRVFKHYQDEAAWKQEKREEYFRRRSRQDPSETTMWTFEPHVASKVYDQMIREAGVPVVKAERLDLKDGVKKEGMRIVSIRMESGKAYTGKMFVDATYEGDLMARAGVSYHVGREANEVYGETLNGWQPKLNTQKHRFLVKVDPFVKSGDPASGLLPGIRPGPLPADGSGDKGVQAYCFRMCTTDAAENRRAWPKPANYDERQYELLLRNFEAGDDRAPWNPVWMPNRKTDTNNNCAVSTDWIGFNHDYPEADHATREKIIAAHRDYQLGLMWTLANNPRVPEKVRAEFQRLGLAKDEFVDNDNWPHQLYVREARRMVSDYVMSEQNCRGSRIAEDSVGMGAYGMDSHNVWRFVTAEGFVQNEGDIQVHGFTPYPISYRSIVPKATECTNLFVPVCLSASHIAYGSIRMEPVFMVLGQSSAVAAVMAIDAEVDVQKVEYGKLREKLVAEKQALAWTGPRATPAGGIDASKLQGVVVDDTQAELKGPWVGSASVGPFVGGGYRHDGDGNKGAMTATFAARLPKAGRYEVRVSYTAHSNRASGVPVAVRHTGGESAVMVDQKKAPAIDKAWHSVGTFEFGESAAVVIGNQETAGYVVIDAVQFLPRQGD